MQYVNTTASLSCATRSPPIQLSCSFPLGLTVCVCVLVCLFFFPSLLLILREAYSACCLLLTLALWRAALIALLIEPVCSAALREGSYLSPRLGWNPLQSGGGRGTYTKITSYAIVMKLHRHPFSFVYFFFEYPIPVICSMGLPVHPSSVDIFHGRQLFSSWRDLNMGMMQVRDVSFQCKQPVLLICLGKRFQKGNVR